MLGMDIGVAFGGVVFIETVYGLPGVGQYLFRALPQRDLPVMMGVVLVVCLAVVVANLVVDLLYPLLDPKIRPAGRRTRAPRLPRVSPRTQPKLDVSRSAT
jgi:peptide/nickel transport system permease protein